MTEKLPFKHKCTIQVDNLLLNLFIDTPVNIPNTHLPASVHRHSYSQIFVCKSGQSLIQTQTQNIVLFPDDIAIVPSGIMHLGTSRAETESQWISIGFSCSECISQSGRDIYSPISRLTEQNEIIVYKNQAILYDILCNIRDNCGLDNEPSFMMDFISVLLRLSRTVRSPDTATNNSRKSKNKNMDRLITLDYFINHEFMNPLTNKKIADELHIGERQLSRLVSTHYGATLHTLLLNKRISVAAKLLSESNDTIESIALAVGFSSKMNFYREFKKAYQMTPAQYRNAVSQSPG